MDLPDDQLSKDLLPTAAAGNRVAALEAQILTCN